MSRLRVERRDRVAVVTLDDPKRRNAFDLELVAEMVAALDAIESDPGVGAVVVTGAPPAFCAGADLGHLGDAAEDGLRAVYEGFLRVARSPLPTVAAVNGPAVGAGMNLALACDVRVAGRSARFDTRFLDLGLHPGGGHTWMLKRAVGSAAARAMVLFGQAVDGERAAAIGLAWECVPDAEVVDRSVELAARAASAPAELARRIKATLDTDHADHSTAVEAELADQVWSVGQPAFAERLAALRARVAGGSR